MPTAVKRREGNPGRRPLNDAEPAPSPDRPPCPQALDRYAKRRWRYLVRELEAMGTRAHSDQGTIAAAAAAWSQWFRAEMCLKALRETRACRLHPALRP